MRRQPVRSRSRRNLISYADAALVSMALARYPVSCSVRCLAALCSLTSWVCGCEDLAVPVEVQAQSKSSSPRLACDRWSEKERKLLWVSARPACFLTPSATECSGKTTGKAEVTRTVRRGTTAATQEQQWRGGEERRGTEGIARHIQDR